MQSRTICSSITWYSLALFYRIPWTCTVKKWILILVISHRNLLSKKETFEMWFWTRISFSSLSLRSIKKKNSILSNFTKDKRITIIPLSFFNKIKSISLFGCATYWRIGGCIVGLGPKIAHLTSHCDTRKWTTLEGNLNHEKVGSYTAQMKKIDM